MLATAGELPEGPGWSFEFKWDGVRALAVVGPAGAHWFARSGAEITKAYPDLAGVGEPLAADGITDAVLDGEIVVLDESGRPSFVALSQRMHVRDPGQARALASALPVSYMVFDILSANGTDVRAVPYVERRELLESLAPRLGEGGRFIVAPRFADGPATVAAARELALEGVVAKRLTSTYRSGVRSPDWIKLKHDRNGDYVVGAWRIGRRELGALLVGIPVEGGLRYRGRVGGGISAAVERDLLRRLGPLVTKRSPFVDAVPREDLKGASYVEPMLVVEVRYGNLTPDGRLRFPRFVRLRPDKDPAEVTDE
jgi:bifunctional non-homologous end joining protein LigD